MLYRNIVIDEHLSKTILWKRINVQMVLVAVWDGNRLKELNQIYYNEQFKPVHGEYKNCLYISTDLKHLGMMKEELSDMSACFVNTGFNDVPGMDRDYEVSLESLQSLLEENDFCPKKL